MKYHLKQNDSYSFASITLKECDTVSAYITIDIHEEQSVSKQALQLMFGDSLLSGAGKYSRAEFLSAVNFLGASIGVSVIDGTLTISLKTVSQNFKKLLPLVDTMLTKPLFLKSEIERIRTTVTNQLHDSKEDSKSISYNGLRNTLYGQGDRKFTFNIDDLVTEVQSIQNSQLFKKLHRSLLTKSWTCSMAGEASSITALEKVVKRIKKGYSKPNSVASVHQQKAPQSIVVLKNIPSRQNIDLSIGAPLPFTLHHPDYPPLVFGVSVLGKWGGFTGRLMSTVREKEGLTYGIYSRLEGFSGVEQGFWSTMTFFSPDKALQGLTATFREINKLYQEGISEAELNKFKIILGTQQTLIQDSVSGLLADLHSYHCRQFTLSEMKEHKERLLNLSKDDVNRAIRTYLNPTTLTISGAGPVSSVKKSIQALINSM